MNKAVDTAVTTAVRSLHEGLFRKNQSRDLNAAISLVKCNYVCLRFETSARKAEFAKWKKVVCFCSANFWSEICKLIIFSKQFQNGIFCIGLIWGLYKHILIHFIHQCIMELMCSLFLNWLDWMKLFTNNFNSDSYFNPLQFAKSYRKVG